MLGNIFILGDSYSTFKGYIPEGYDAFYGDDGPEYLVKANVELCDKDVRNVEQTWWYNLANEMGTLIRNCSWSGTTICHTGYSGKDVSHKSFVTRIQKLIGEKYFEQNKVDTFFLFGGTNDSWANAPLAKRKNLIGQSRTYIMYFLLLAILLICLFQKFPVPKSIV